jgi:polyphosphate kinase 2 (PPK2 family)
LDPVTRKNHQSQIIRHDQSQATQTIPRPTRQRGESQGLRDINNFAKHLSRNGTLILKFFLHLSKDEQKRRFLERLTNPEKHWKFSEADLAEREHWQAYQKAFEAALSATSTKRAPWNIVPADRKYVARASVANVVTTAIQNLGLDLPEVTAEKLAKLAAARARLEKDPNGGDPQE